MKSISAVALVFAACAIGPRIRPAERLCKGDEHCWAQVQKAPDLIYYSVDQAVEYGLAYVHELPLVRFPQWNAPGIAVYADSEPGTFRIEVVEVGIENHVLVHLGEHALAWAHAHPQPLPRECAPIESDLGRQLGIPIYIQHAEGPVRRCTNRAGPRLRPLQIH